jgi:hypothetical protein
MSPGARLRLAAGLAALLALALYTRATGPGERLPGPGGAAPAPATVPAPSGIGFRSPRDLAEHHAKHGAEFGGITESEYLRRAQRLRDRPAGGDVRELIRRDGVITRFDRATGEFLAVNPDGTIRTFFRPSAGEVYFQRQAQRSPTR